MQPSGVREGSEPQTNVEQSKAIFCLCFIEFSLFYLPVLLCGAPLGISKNQGVTVYSELARSFQHNNRATEGLLSYLRGQSSLWVEEVGGWLESAFLS